jgi:hypothetical protein
MNTQTESNWVEEVGAPAYASIVEMVAALECDYDRLEELRTDLADWECDPDLPELKRDHWTIAYPEEAAELKELEEAAGECTLTAEAHERIQEDALSVEVRSGWHEPARCGDTFRPEDFKILLCTGGPAVQIRGELDEDGEPRRAWLEVQDWGKPWTQYFKADQDTLLAYARCFYFGEG